MDGVQIAPASGVRGLRVYQLAYKTAMEVFRLSRLFPADERYSLVSQIRRSSRSVAANIAEGYRKRQYPAMFASKLAAYGEIGRMLNSAISCPEKFAPR